MVNARMTTELFPQPQSRGPWQMKSSAKGRTVEIPKYMYFVVVNDIFLQPAWRFQFLGLFPRP